MRKVTLFCLLLAGLPVLSSAATIVLDFEGLNDLQPIASYYNGGLAGDGVGPGPSYGITFSSNALSIVGAQENEAKLPSGGNGLVFLSGSAATLNIPAGFTTGFSFFYSAPFYPGFVKVYSGPNDTGTLIAQLNLGQTADGKLMPGCGGKDYCGYVPIGVSFAGTAESVDFGGTENYIVFDNITFGASTPQGGGGSAPEPSTLLLMIPAALGVVLYSRKRHLAK